MTACTFLHFIVSSSLTLFCLEALNSPYTDSPLHHQTELLAGYYYPFVLYCSIAYYSKKQISLSTFHLCLNPIHEIPVWSVTVSFNYV